MKQLTANGDTCQLDELLSSIVKNALSWYASLDIQLM